MEQTPVSGIQFSAPVSPRPGLYLVSRTSALGKACPCDEAFRVLITHTDTRQCDDPKKIPSNKGTDGDWYMYGTNHRVENGCIKRELVLDEWAVEIEDVHKFVDKYGECIVGRDCRGFFTIEIYDDYRE